MDSKDEKPNEEKGDDQSNNQSNNQSNDQSHDQSHDQSDAKSWFNFGNRTSSESSQYGVLRIHEDSIEYDMKHKKFGKCLIFNHEYYKGNICEQRKGSTADATALYDCFGRIGFDVELKNDLDCNQLFQFISKVSKEDHSDNDCLVCCILTHGQTDSLWAYDQIYAFDDILSFFSGDKCKSLAGKPKIFIIQACRGFKFDDGVNVRVASDVCDSRDSQSKIVKIPVFADYLIAYSSMSGFYSWRNVSDGSWFVTHLTDVINKYHKQYDLLSMLTVINQRIAYTKASKAKEDEFNDKKQVPCITHTLTRKIYLMPKENASRSTYL